MSENIKDHVLIQTIEDIVDESEESPTPLPFGEINTASNRGTIGQGLYDSKEGVDLRFKNLEAGSGIVLTPDTIKHTVKIDVESIVFDNRSSPFSTGSIAGSGGSITKEFNVGAFDKGLAHVVHIEKVAGASSDITIQLYDDNPAGTGVLIYEVPNFDIDAANLDDRNIWYLETININSLWLMITNDSATPVTLDVGLRIKGE